MPSVLQDLVGLLEDPKPKIAIWALDQLLGVLMLPNEPASDVFQESYKLDRHRCRLLLKDRQSMEGLLSFIITNIGPPIPIEPLEVAAYEGQRVLHFLLRAVRAQPELFLYSPFPDGRPR